MKIPCISCHSIFRLDSSLVKATGSMVRCTKCEYIFMVYPPSFDDKPVVQDTNIAQPVLFDFFQVDQTARDKGILPEPSKIFNRHKVDEIASIKDIDEEDDCGSDVEDVDLAELPDPSEHEDTINWYDPPDADELTEHEKHFYNGTQDIDIEKS